MLVSFLGFVFSVSLLFPGVLTVDATWIYDDVQTGHLGDWQSPAMTVLWRLIDPLAPGSGSFMLLASLVYWLAFGLVAVLAGRRSLWAGLALPLMACSPPTILLLGMVWRDVLFGAAWLAAAACGLAVARCRWKTRLPAQAAGLALVAYGVLLRPNALAAAPFMVAALVWPSRTEWKRTAALVLPAALSLFGFVNVVYYDLLGAQRQSPLHSVLVFDLGGISHFAHDNAFPGQWSPEQTTLIESGCYNPKAWDFYWTIAPCLFVMTELERGDLFGSPQLVQAWWHAIVKHPLAYIEHRATFMAEFLFASDFSIVQQNDEAAARSPPSTGLDAGVRMRLIGAMDWVTSDTPVNWAATWLLLDLGLCGAMWRWRRTPEGTFVLAVCGSAVVYVASFAALGVSTEVRYHYWAVLAALAGMAMTAAAWSSRERRGQTPGWAITAPIPVSPATT